MTITDAKPSAKEGAARRPLPYRPSSWKWRAFLAGATLVSLAMHLYHATTAYDFFIDEPFYAQVGHSVAQGQLPFAAGVHFFLHPPGFFYLEAAWMHVAGMHTAVFAQVFSLRKLVAVFAALTVLMIALILERAVNRRAAVFGALVYLLNAFVQRDSAIVILEPATVFFALAGYALLVRLAPVGTSRRRTQLIAVGLLFGVSILNKEFALFITIVPLLLAFALKSWLTRREALLTASLAAAPYTLWVFVVVASGNWSTFWFQLSTGFRRTAGTTQLTGFNQAGAPSFLDTLIRNLSYLWTAYAILALGSLAILYLAWRPGSALQRFLACYGLGALPLLSYCMLIGTNEEQFFNFLLAPALIALIAVCWGRWAQLRVGLRLALVGLAAAGLVSDAINYAVIRTSSDNGTYLVDKWMATHVPIGNTVAVTNSVQREIFTRYTMVDDASGQPLSSAVSYLVVFYRQVDEHYAFVDRSTVDAQTKTMQQVFTMSDRSNGRIAVYQAPAVKP